jgi:RNA polymerase sigma-70 factor (ECF subfamily)
MVHTRDIGFMGEVVKLRPQLYARAIQMMGNAAAADDLVQDTLERAIRNCASFRSGTCVMAWVGTILRNLAIDRWRSPVPLSIELDTLPSPASEGTEATERDPLDLISLGDLRAAVARLPARDRQLFELAYFQRVRHREIALRLRTRINTVGTQLFRAKAKVRVLLQETYDRRLAQASPCPLALVQSKAEPVATPRSIGPRSRTDRNPATGRARRPSNG